MKFYYVSCMLRVITVLTMFLATLQPLSASWWHFSATHTSPQTNTFADQATWFGFGGLLLGSAALLYSVWNTKKLKRQIRQQTSTLDSVVIQSISIDKVQPLFFGKDSLTDDSCVYARWMCSDAANRESLGKKQQATMNDKISQAYIRSKELLKKIPTTSDQEIMENLQLVAQMLDGSDWLLMSSKKFDYRS